MYADFKAGMSFSFSIINYHATKNVHLLRKHRNAANPLPPGNPDCVAVKPSNTNTSLSAVDLFSEHITNISRTRKIERLAYSKSVYYTLYGLLRTASKCNEFLFRETCNVLCTRLLKRIEKYYFREEGS